MTKKHLRSFFGIVVNDFRTLKKISFIMMGLLAFQILFVLWIMYMEKSKLLLLGSMFCGGEAAEIENMKLTVSIFILQPLLIFAIPVSMTAMLNTLFGAYSRRDASDYYHSLPLSRTELFISHVLVSTVVSIVITYVATIISKIFLKIYVGSFFVIDGSGDGKIFLYSIIVGLMVGGALILARTFTSGGASALFTTFFILVFPRQFLLFIKALIAKSVPYVVIRFSIFDDGRHNLLFGTFARAMDNNVKDIFGNSYDICYSIILAFVYIVVGYILFIFRKDERIDNYVNSKKGLFIFSFMKGLKYSLIPIASLTALVLEKNSLMAQMNDENDLFQNSNEIIILCVVLYLIGMIYYFKDQLINLPKYKNLITIIVGFVVLVLINVGFIGGFYWYTEWQKTRFSNDDDIKYIRLDDFSWNGKENELYSRLNDIKLEEEADKYMFQLALWEENQGIELTGKGTLSNYPVIYADTTTGGIRRYIGISKCDLFLFMQPDSYLSTYFTKDILPSPEAVVVDEEDDYSLIYKEWYELYYEEIQASDKEFYQLANEETTSMDVGEDLEEVYLTFEIDGRQQKWGFPVLYILEESAGYYMENIKGHNSLSSQIMEFISAGGLDVLSLLGN